MKKLVVMVICVCLATGAHAQIRLGPCRDADRFRFRESELQSIVDALDTSIALTETFVVAEDTSSGNCFINAAEVGSGIRFSAEFRVTDPIPLRDNVTISFVTDDDRSDPFLLQIEVAAGDIRFATVRPADISVPCLALDRSLVGTSQDLKVQLVYIPPSPGHNDFRLDRATASFGTVTVQNPDATIPSFTPITTAINNHLALSSVRSTIDGILENTIRSQSYVTGNLPTALDQLFWLAAPGSQSSASICSTTLGASPPFAAACAEADCADYRIRP